MTDVEKNELLTLINKAFDDCRSETESEHMLQILFAAEDDATSIVSIIERMLFSIEAEIAFVREQIKSEKPIDYRQGPSIDWNFILEACFKSKTRILRLLKEVNHDSK